jgi:trigger factor
MAILEITSERNDENKVEMTVTIPADEVQKHINAAYKEAGRARIRGFRQGKAPRRVLENYYGGKEYFQAQATDALVKETCLLAIDAEGYVPLDKPEVAELELAVEGNEYTYSMSFEVRPALELSSYEPIQIELPSEEPTPEEIEEQIDTMLGYYVDFENVTDRPVQQGDFLTLEMEVTRDDARLEALSGDSIPHEIGSGSMPTSFDEQMLGAAIGETREFDFAASSEEVGQANAGESSHAVVTVKEIKAEIKPDLTDAWVKEQLEFDSVDEFKTRISDSIRARKQRELASLKERLISEELASRLQGEPTDMLITQTEQELYRDFFTSLQRNNQTFDGFLANAGTTPDVFRKDIREQATELTAQTLALDALARHLGLEITDDEIHKEFESSGAEDPEELYQQWKDNGRLSEIREGLLRVKAANYLNENAEVFEPGTKPAAKEQKATAKEKEDADKDAREAQSATGESNEEEAAKEVETASDEAESAPSEIAPTPDEVNLASDEAESAPSETAPTLDETTPTLDEAASASDGEESNS